MSRRVLLVVTSVVILHVCICEGAVRKRRPTFDDLKCERFRSLLHEFYIEIATTKMSKAKFEEFIDKFIEAAAKDDDAG